jgi:acetyl-CoA acetyltransferase
MERKYMAKAIVAGVDMIKFVKPGLQKPFRVMAADAVRGAIGDAGIDERLIEQAYGSYVYGDSTCAQHALYDVMQTGIPVINVNNNCASGSTAIFLARQAVESGAVDCALAFGFEEMQRGALGSSWDDRESPFDTFNKVLDDLDYRMVRWRCAVLAQPATTTWKSTVLQQNSSPGYR